MSDRVLEMDLFNGEPEKSINVEDYQDLGQKSCRSRKSLNNVQATNSDAALSIPVKLQTTKEKQFLTTPPVIKSSRLSTKNSFGGAALGSNPLRLLTTQAQQVQTTPAPVFPSSSSSTYNSLEANPPVQYEIYEHGTIRGNPMLSATDGYEYTVKKKKKDHTIIWCCSKRTKSSNCPATIIQDGEIFKHGSRVHIHDKSMIKKKQVDSVPEKNRTEKVCYEIKENATMRGKRKLVATDGNEFTVKVQKKDHTMHTIWRCSNRDCNVSVIQDGDNFRPCNRKHVHPAEKESPTSEATKPETCPEGTLIDLTMSDEEDSESDTSSNTRETDTAESNESNVETVRSPTSEVTKPETCLEGTLIDLTMSDEEDSESDTSSNTRETDTAESDESNVETVRVVIECEDTNI